MSETQELAQDFKEFKKQILVKIKDGHQCYNVWNMGTFLVSVTKTLSLDLTREKSNVNKGGVLYYW